MGDELEVTELGRDQLIKHIRKLEGALGRSEERALEQATRAHRLEQEQIKLNRQIESQGRRLGQVMGAKHILVVKAGQKLTIEETDPPPILEDPRREPGPTEQVARQPKLPELQPGWHWSITEDGYQTPIWNGQGDPPSGPHLFPQPNSPSQEPLQPPSGAGSGSTPSDDPTL